MKLSKSKNKNLSNASEDFNDSDLNRSAFDLDSANWFESSNFTFSRCSVRLMYSIKLFSF